MSFGVQGVTTSYSFQSFTPRPYGISKNLDKKLQRQNSIAVEARRNVRQAQVREAQNVLASEQAFQGLRINRAMKALRKESPFDVFCAQVLRDVENTGLTRVAVSTAEIDEALGLLPEEADEEYNSTSLASATALFRPFTTASVAPTSGLLPYWETPTELNPLAVLSNKTLNPFASGHDVEFAVWGSTYQGLHTYRRNYDENSARLIGVRGPQVMVGWGYDLAGAPTPGAGGSFTSGYLRRFDTWKAGPIDHRWDQFRKTWTSFDNFAGTATADIPADGSGYVTLQGVTGANNKLYCQNPFTDSPIASGQAVMAMYSPHPNRTYAVPIMRRADVRELDGSPVISGARTISFDQTYGLQVLDSGNLEAVVRGREFTGAGLGMRGIVPSGPNDPAYYLNAQGGWTAPTSSGLTASGTTYIIPYNVWLYGGTVNYSISASGAPGTILFGYNGVEPIVTADSCSGSTLSVTTQNFTYRGGLLVGVT